MPPMNEFRGIRGMEVEGGANFAYRFATERRKIWARVTRARHMLLGEAAFLAAIRPNSTQPPFSISSL